MILFQTFKTPFCIGNYIGEALPGWVISTDAHTFIRFFIDFCSSREAEATLAKCAKQYKRNPYWSLEDAQKHMRIYLNSLLISAYMKNVVIDLTY